MCTSINLIQALVPVYIIYQAVLHISLCNTYRYKWCKGAFVCLDQDSDNRNTDTVIPWVLLVYSCCAALEHLDSYWQSFLSSVLEMPIPTASAENFNFKSCEAGWSYEVLFLLFLKINFTSFLPFFFFFHFGASQHLPCVGHVPNYWASDWEEASDLLLILTLTSSFFFSFFCVQDARFGLFSSESCLQNNYYA